MKTKVKRAIGTTMFILMFVGLYVVLYVILFVSACGVLVERGWELWDAIRAMGTLLVGFPLAIGYILLALHLYLDGGDDE